MQTPLEIGKSTEPIALTLHRDSADFWIVVHLRHPLKS